MPLARYFAPTVQSGHRRCFVSHRSYSLNSLREVYGGYIGVHIGSIKPVVKADTRSADCSSYRKLLSPAVAWPPQMGRFARAKSW